ncbi:MAG: HAD-IIA family hydrolase [Candidatus Lokiarchaeota archaeon]
MRKLKENLKNINLAIFDLDGVIYREKHLIPNVDKIIEELKNSGIKIIFNSNNSTITREMYVKKLKKMNIETEISDFYTSASITASEITKLKINSNIFVIGEIGLKEELKAKGHNIVENEAEYMNIDFVVVGLDRDFHYKKLATAQKCILEGKAKFYATNSDSTLPALKGLLPGAGVMVNSVTTCTNRKPIKIFGKPNPYGIEQILEDTKVSKEKAVMFGDRLNTDILAGNRAGIHTILVQTGVSNVDDIKKLEKEIKKGKIIETLLFPNMIISSLDAIFQKF